MTTIAVESRTLTSAELARTLRRPLAYVEELLRESEAMGVVERAAGGWRLTAAAETRFGAALRSIGPLA